MEPINTFSGRIVAVPINDTDTDQIIPARYLKVTDKAGLGQGLFSTGATTPTDRPSRISCSISRSIKDATHL